MIALALCLAICWQTEATACSEEVDVLRQMCGYPTWPAPQVLEAQAERYRRHVEWLRNRQVLYGWSGGLWERWIWESEQAVCWWLLAADAVEATGWWEREKLRALLELEGPYWGSRLPPLLPPPETMPLAPDSPNNAAGP